MGTTLKQKPSNKDLINVIRDTDKKNEAAKVTLKTNLSKNEFVDIFQYTILIKKTWAFLYQNNILDNAVNFLHKEFRKRRVIDLIISDINYDINFRNNYLNSLKFLDEIKKR